MKNFFNPLVSIIIPVYNGSNYVKEAIDSALAQTYKNVEIIVVNDGSTDNTESILKNYGSKIRFYNKKNGGVATALNLAIEKSKGAYISWLSHDDVYLKEKIQVNIETLSNLEEEKKQNTILYSNYIVINEKSNQLRESVFHNQHQAEKLNSPFYPLFNGLIHGCSLLIPKKCFTKNDRFDPKLRTTQDYDLWYRMFPKYNIHFISKSTIKSRSHAEQGSQSNKEQHFKNCDTLWINMINSIDQKQINFMYGGLLPFYQRILKIVSDAKFIGVSNYIKQKISEYQTMENKKFNPLVSIIIPVYNGSNYIKEAIDSALAQTYKNVEIIVVNDGSTDNTESILKSYGSKIRFYNKKNGGTATALNLALKKTKGEYISWLSHDDVYLENKIQTNIEVLSNLEAKERQNIILYSNYIVIDKDSNQTWESSFHKEHFIEKLNFPFYPIFNGLIHGCSLLIPKKCFTEIDKFDPNLRTTHDYDLWYRMFPKYNIHFISKSTIKSRSHAEQVSKKRAHFKECDSLWINMINSVDREQINFMYGGLLPFYQRTLKITSDAKYNGVAKYLKQKIDEYKPRKQEDILVSVIIPFYNRINWTLEAIKSVIDQTHKNWELILINDASTDNFDSIVEIIKNDKRIKLFNKEKNSGPAESRNIGIEKAQGEFIAFLDSDDLFLPNKIELQLEFMLKKEIMLSHTSYLLYSEESSDKQIIKAGAIDFSYPEIILNCMVATYTIMAHRDVFKNKSNRFPENLRIGEDVCLWIQLARSFLFKGYDLVLTQVRRHQNQAAYNNKTQIQGLTNILDFLINNSFLNEKSATAILTLNNSLQELISKTYIKGDVNKGVPEVNIPESNYNPIKTIQMKKWLIKIIRKILLCTPGFRKMQILEDLIFDNKDKIIEMSSKINQLSLIEEENQTKLETKLDEKFNQFSISEKKDQAELENKIDQLVTGNKENQTKLETKLDEKFNQFSISEKKNQTKLIEKIQQLSINETINQAKLENKIDQLAINEAVNQAKLLEKFDKLSIQDRENQYKLAERLEKIEQLSSQDRENQYKLAERLEKISIENKEILKSKIETQGERLEILFDEFKKDVDISPLSQNVNILGENIEIAQTTKSKTFEYFNESIENFLKIMKKYILKTDIVLDIGCGIRPQTFFAPKVHICIEPFEEYRKVLKPYFPNKSFFISIKTYALSGIKDFDDNSVDTVFLLDLIEHLDKNEGLELLKEIDRVARKQIVIYTPLGFFPQHYENGNEKDAWGLSGSLLQEHKSGWLPEDFGKGWDFHICRDAIEPFLEKEREKNIKYSGLMAIKTKKFIGFPVQSNTPEFVKTLFTNRRGQSHENINNSRDEARDNKISASHSRIG